MKKIIVLLTLVLLTGSFFLVLPGRAANVSAGSHISLTPSTNESSQTMRDLSDLSSPVQGPGKQHPLMHFTAEQLDEMQRQLEVSPKYSAPPTIFASLTGARSLLSYISYVPAERDQGTCGDCWVWAPTGALEIDHTVNSAINDRLSVQYFNSKYHNGAGACCGGTLGAFTDWYSSDKTPIPWSNTNASFGDYTTQSCQSSIPIGSISSTPHYNLKSLSYQTITTYGVSQATAVNNIKSALNANKAVVYSFWYGDPGWSDFLHWWNYYNETSIFEPDKHADETNAGGHGVLIVGYDDTVPGNEYWLVLNSWGTNGLRPHGLFRLKMYMNYSADYYSEGYPGQQQVFQILNSDFTTVSVPVSNFTASVLSGTKPLPVAFTDLSSNTPTGWAWYFGDETYAAPWTQMTASAGWSARYGQSGVTLPDGSIVIIGGMNSSGLKNDVWRSTNNGATWTQSTPAAWWWARYLHTSVALPDGSIVLMGGFSSDGGRKNDVWRSRDGGFTWAQMTASAGWSARYGQSGVSLPDGSIVLFGGTDTSGLKNDTWRSRDSGATWIPMNASAGWSARSDQSTVVMPDGSIILMGGVDGTSPKNDVWRSTDYGATWSLATSNAGWSARSMHSCVLIPDGSIMLMGGIASAGEKNDVWRLTTVGSSARNPSHTYSTSGIYTVALQAYNTGGYNSTRKTGYITVTAPPALIANFTTNTSTGTAPLAVGFTDLSTGGTPTRWNWSFGDGSWFNTTLASQRNATHLYATAGTYTAYVTVSNAGSSSTSAGRTITITSPPVFTAAFTTNTSTGTAPLVIGFTDLSTGATPTRWNWSFGDGTWFNTTLASQRNATHLYATAGTYTAYVTVSNSGSSSTSAGRIITITSPPSLIANFTTNTVSGTSPLVVQFTDTTTGGIPTLWNWSFGDGSWFNTTLASERNATHLYATATTRNASSTLSGTYTAYLIVSNSEGSSTSAGRTISVISPPALIANFTTNTVSGTSPLVVQFTDTTTGGTPTLWNWSFGDGTWFNTTLASERNATHLYATAGTCTAHLTVSNPGSYSMSDGRIITVTSAFPPASTRIGVTNGQQWYLDTSGNGLWDSGIDAAYNFGAPGWTPIVGDWNATGRSSIGVTNAQQWYLDWNGNGAWDGADKVYTFGAPGWTNVTGDWNHDGKTEIGVTNGQQWYLDTNGNGAWDTGIDAAYNFGAPGWTPIIGDWNGSGYPSIGITNGQQWYLDGNGNGVWDWTVDKTYTFGAPGWTPIVGDWNATGKTSIGVTNSQQWYLDTNGNGVWDGADKAYSFGAPGWGPVLGDWNSDGRTKIGVTNSQQWYLDTNGNGIWDIMGIDSAYSFGAPGWSPIVGKWGKKNGSAEFLLF